MQVKLKQSEIVAALKMYISQQGISLNNKYVEVTFTAGRGDTGITADLDIEDKAEAAPVAKAEAAPSAPAAAATVEAAAPAQAVTEEAVVAEEAPVANAQVKSLFG